MRAKIAVLPLVAPLFLSGCIGQSVWSCWESAHLDSGLAPMRRLRVIAPIKEAREWETFPQSTDAPFAWTPNHEPANIGESAAYFSAIVESLGRSGVVVVGDADAVDGTLVLRPWFHHAGARGTNTSGVEVRIERATDGQHLFSGSFIGAPAYAARAIADLVASGWVNES
jgi:hypothetical protein